MSKYENFFIKIFQKENIYFEREKTYKDLQGGKFRFDFYLPEKGILIEVDGEQHFKPIYGRQSFLKGQEHDRRKNSYCLANNIALYRIPYWDIYQIKTFKEMLQDKYLVRSRWHSDGLVIPH